MVDDAASVCSILQTMCRARAGTSSAEMMKGAAENRDELLIAAQDMSFRASEDLLRVGDVLWPGEYRPH